MVSAPEKKAVLPAGFLCSLQVEPVGRFFLSHWRRSQCVARGTSISGQDNISESESEVSDGEELEFEDDLNYLRSLDPKECKDQDHYRVLGLGQVRGKATDEHIRKAYRFKVLRHHPDKRRAGGEEVRENDDYFTCITRAFEQLGTPSKRRAYDSIDPSFDDDIPDQIKGDKDFFALFEPVFTRNEKWSTRSPVPKLCGIDASREQVDRFYKFWYDFESWREFSYLDEEDKEKGSDREERRWIEKNNRVQRAERKKEEMKRIRRLVDNAYNSDPRIALFREKDKQDKLAKKQAKMDAARARKEEEERIRKEAEDREREERLKAETEQREKVEELKREKDVMKKMLKKERKVLRGRCKEANFFTTPDDQDMRVHLMAELDKMCELLSLADLEDINKQMDSMNTDEQKQVFVTAVKQLNEKLDKDKMDLVEKSAKSSASSKTGSGVKEWSSDDLALLIKAVNLFPAGTNQRWEVVASFINQHTKCPDVVRNAKEALSKAKELQHEDFHLSSLKEEANKRAYENLERKKKKDIKMDDVEATQRTESAAEAQGLNMSPWSSDEQKLLEQALKTYSASLGPERWDKVAACIPNRSKKDCMRRYKELAELVRAKKAALAAATASSKK